MSEAQDAFFVLDYVVAPEELWKDGWMLHVSDHPMKAGLAVLIAASDPRALPGVVWEKKSNKE